MHAAGLPCVTLSSAMSQEIINNRTHRQNAVAQTTRRRIIYHAAVAAADARPTFGAELLA
jgi:hypothetical protein